MFSKKRERVLVCTSLLKVCPFVSDVKCIYSLYMKVRCNYFLSLSHVPFNLPFFFFFLFPPNTKKNNYKVNIKIKSGDDNCGILIKECI